MRFVGVCCEPPNLCIVTEYLAGGSLYDLLHGGSRRPPGTEPGPLRLAAPLALRLASDIAAGMAYLHSQSIIHRDLKSANLLLDAQDRVKGAPGTHACVKQLGGLSLTTAPRPAPQWRTLALRAGWTAMAA